MCGICGFVGAGTVEDLGRMSDQIAHRGPDASSAWYDDDKQVYLGHRRLSIVDLSGGTQPMWTNDERLGIIFNGEIYNHLELRKQLIIKGYKFVTDHSDTEVLLHGYREWGIELPKYLNGMWAFVIYDKTANQLFISRDRFGKKPLYYTQQNGVFAFASELSSITKHQSVQALVSTKSLKKYFAYGYIPAPNTLLQQVYKLPGGHNLILDISSLQHRVIRYWQYLLEPTDIIPANPEKVWGEELVDLLDKATQRRLMADVPLGIFLSGGVDSSAITALASRHIEEGKLKTFSIGFNEASFDESEYSTQIATLFKTDHHLEILSLSKAQQLAQTIATRLDEPMGDSSLLPTYLLCHETRKHVTVALGGDGADELFGGYEPYKILQKAEWYGQMVPKPVHEGIRMLAGLIPTSFSNMSLDFKVKRMLRGLSYPAPLWMPVWLGPLAPTELEELFNEPVDLEEVYSEAIENWENCPSRNITDRVLQFYTNLYLQDDILVKADRASMMNSLEARSPFLDIEVANFARKLPHHYKYRNGETKYLLKKALEPVLPHNILYRPKKGFAVPIGKWFQENKFNWQSNAHFSALNPTFVKRCQDEQTNKQADHRAFLWNSWLLSYNYFNS